MNSPVLTQHSSRRAMAFGFIIAYLALMMILLWPIYGVVGQAYALLALFIAFGCWPPMRRWVGGMPLPYQVIFIGMLLSVVAGHFTLNKVRFYPFVAWEIFPFVHERDPAVAPQLMATTASGRKVRLLAEQIFPSIIQFNFPDADHPQDRELLARTLAHSYNLRHQDDIVKSVDLLEASVPLHPRAGEELLSCHLLQRYDISSDH